MNAFSPATRFRLDGTVIHFDEVPGVAPSNFETRIRGMIGKGEVIRMRLVTSRARTPDLDRMIPIFVDIYQLGYVDLDDLLASDARSFQMNLLHLLAERAAVTNYTRRIGSSNLRVFIPGTNTPTPEFRRAHNAGFAAEALFLQQAFGDSTIRFERERAGPRDGDDFVFRSNEGYQVVHSFAGPQSALTRGGRVFVITAAGQEVTVENFLQQRAAAAAPAAPAPAAP